MSVVKTRTIFPDYTLKIEKPRIPLISIIDYTTVEEASIKNSNKRDR